MGMGLHDPGFLVGGLHVGGLRPRGFEHVGDHRFRPGSAPVERSVSRRPSGPARGAFERIDVRSSAGHCTACRALRHPRSAHRGQASALATMRVLGYPVEARTCMSSRATGAWGAVGSGIAG